MAVLVEQLLTGYTDPSGQMRRTLGEFITPTQASSPTYPRAFYHPRTPVVITTRSWLLYGENIQCFCNPSGAGWSLPRRESVQKTAAGQVLNTWKNRYRNSYFDAFPVTFSFQSGSILPSAAYDPAMVSEAQIVADSEAPVVPAGLDNFYKFMALTDQPKLGGTQANYHIMVYHSRIFPELWLEGWFQPEGMTWRDEGNFVNWECPMLVLRTVPHLSNYDLMMGLYQDWVRSNAVSEMATASALQKIGQNRMASAFSEGIQSFSSSGQNMPGIPPNPKDPDGGEAAPKTTSDETLSLLRAAAGMQGGKVDPARVAASREPGSTTPVTPTGQTTPPGSNVRYLGGVPVDPAE